MSIFVYDNFSQGTLIYAKTMIRWCSTNQDINSFFELINKDLPSIKKVIQNPKLKLYTPFNELDSTDIIKDSIGSYEDAYFDTKKTDYKNQEQKIEFLIELNSHLNELENSIYKGQLNAEIEWVYGIRCHDVINNFCYHTDNNRKGTSEKIIFFASKIIIIYYYRLNEQKHYIEHDKEICSLAVSKGSIVASGEKGSNPSIHIWDINTRKNIHTISDLHKGDIYLLNFSNSDQYLISCTKRMDTPIYIFLMKDYSMILSVSVNDFGINVCNIYKILVESKPVIDDNYNKKTKGNDLKNRMLSKMGHEKSASDISYVNEYDITDICDFIILSSTKMYYFENNGIVFTKTEVDISKFKDVSPITAGLAYYIPVDIDQEKYIKKNEFYMLTGHSNGDVLVWKSMNIPRKWVKFTKFSVISIVLLKEGIAIMVSDMKIHIYDHELKSEINTIELNEFPFKWYSNKLKSMISADRKLFILSYGGDLIKYKLKGRTNAMNSYSKQQPKGTRFKDIIALPSKLNAMSLIEKNNEKLLFISTDQNAVIGFLVDSHEIIDIYNTRSKVTAMDSITFENKAPMFAYGTEDGEILIREDWQDNPTSFQLRSECRVNDIKFSINGNDLVAVTEMGEIYKFKLYNNSYFDQSDNINKNSFRLNNRAGIPLSINFTNDRKHVIITTDTREHYKVELQDFKSEQSIDDSSFNISYLETRFSLNPKIRDNFKNVSCLLGQELKFICSGDFFGNLMIWKNVNELNENCGVLVGGHSSQINSLVLSRNQDYLFSMGSTDRTIIEWKINVTHEKVQEAMEQDSTAKNSNKNETEIFSEENYTPLNHSRMDKGLDSNLMSPTPKPKKYTPMKKNHINQNMLQISD